ncbi:MAG: hypothetical protein GEV11_14610 [Streptosporangiales bacterium]|nr:hypothetical protein [Streptosporangiales bacterium]
MFVGEDRHLRRRRLQGAVLGRAEPPGLEPPPPRAVHGRLLDASPQLLTIATEGGHRRFTLTTESKAWYRRPVAPVDLRPGSYVVLRRHPSGPEVVDRVWADITRVTGTILRRDREGVVIDAGHTRGRQVVTIPYRASGRIQVRHPKLEPGYLFDAIGVRTADGVEALLPATSQPPHRADAVPPRGRPRNRTRSLGGTVTWFDPGPGGPAHGAAYPAVARDDCGEVCDRVRPTTLPVLALGSRVALRNDCTGVRAALLVAACASAASRFTDRCVSCGTSPRGRVAELTALSYVDMGGELDQGCFNASMHLGER